MKKKTIVIISSIILLIIIMTGIIVATLSSSKTSISEDIFYKGDGIEMTEERLNKIINHMNNHKELVIYYSIYENVYDKNNNFIERIENVKISSIVNLDKKTDETYNTYLLFDENGELKTSANAFEQATINFKNFFKFDYRNCDGIYELICQLSKTQNTNPDLFLKSKLNTEYYDLLYKEYGQKHYVFKNEQILQEIQNYDNIINVSSGLILEEHGGQEFISTIENTITYEKGKYEIDKTFIINFELQESTDESNCSCSSDTDCNTGDDNGISCSEDSDC